MVNIFSTHILPFLPIVYLSTQAFFPFSIVSSLCKFHKVTDRERQLAERYYLKQYATKWVSSQVDEPGRKQFSVLHPRYAHLAEGIDLLGCFYPSFFLLQNQALPLSSL